MKTPKEEQFLTELKALFKKHELAIVPTHNWEIDFHDSMRIIPYDDDAEKYMEQILPLDISD